MNPAVDELARRAGPTASLADDTKRVVRAAYDMSRRFHRGGKLLVFGNGVSATDAQHLSVEFVHPVLVGKRALPALALTNDVATVTGVAREIGFEMIFDHQVRQLGCPEDIPWGSRRTATARMF